MTTLTPLRLFSSMATREVLAVLADQYRRASGQAVTAEAAGGVDVARRVAGGEAFDVVVLGAGVIDRLIAEGHARGPRIDLVRSGVAVAVRAGAARPDVSSEAAVRAAVERAASISYSTGPSGIYLEKLFARWGILETLRPRIIVPPPGVPVGTLVADGRVELGFQQLSELMTLPGIEVLGPLPPEIQLFTVFSGAIADVTDRAEGARALLMYLARPEHAALKQRYGLESPD
ncbi:MAG: substrate-binding domain-containing protein [Steroidobacteraceae bacterium]